MRTLKLDRATSFRPVAMALVTAMITAAPLTGCGPQSPQSPPATSAASAPAPQTGVVSAPLVVKDAWARPPVGNGMTAAYMTIDNHSATPDTLLSATGDVAGSITLHETDDVNGMMSMNEMTAGLQIPAGGSVALKPASFHFMLMDMKRDLKIGDTFKLTLHFKSGQTIPVAVAVRDS